MEHVLKTPHIRSFVYPPIIIFYVCSISVPFLFDFCSISVRCLFQFPFFCAFHSYVCRISKALVSHCPLLSGQLSYAMSLLSHGGSRYCSVVGCCSVAADWMTGSAFCAGHLHIYQTLLASANWSAQVCLRWAVQRLLGQEHGGPCWVQGSAVFSRLSMLVS